ncbi:hypothetical protein DYB37_008840 [Aphanomyces astaci]|uniref:Uncharacterized protein n=1 Tax=Aphanomyces astaci TaxID=112090 RepID=A0A418F6L5_APHAT|nr:hypothetical protein DYB37_008840 [Aphanomyces astaci]
MVSTADFACVSIDGKTALVYASVTKEGKDDVQCMVQSTASTDCFFQDDLASCDAYKKSQPTLAIHCITSSPFCAKVPFVLKNTPSPTPNPNAVPTSALCMRNNTRWTCFADPDSKLVVLVGVVNGTFNCISADTSGTICNVYPSQQACTAQCPSIVERPTLGMKACESSSTGTVSCIAATPTSAAAPSMSKAPAAESSNAADSSLSSADGMVPVDSLCTWTFFYEFCPYALYI